ncbi:Nn.00g071340.m01.CDS01 [Neocucurbitaria sp. VM-36]
MSPPQRILDSHIHLWPATSTQPTHHGWMTPGHQLAKRHGIADYKAVVSTSAKPNSLSSSPPPPPPLPLESISFIYVETDRYLPSPTPEIPESDNADEKRRKLAQWAAQPLEEIKFLRRIVEANPDASGSDGFQASDASLMSGAVLYAPFHLPPALFQTYLQIAEQVAGPALWARVVGFRYLLQGKAEGEVKRLVESEGWLENIVSLREGRGGKGWAFDVGVDTHRDGVEQLESIVGMIQEVRRREASSSGQQGHVRFVLNHLCKPPLPLPSPSPTDTHPTDPTFPRWHSALSALSPDPSIYMKLSGAFNEFSACPVPSTVPALLEAVQPFFDAVLANFPGRLMFGSDWPVCNVGGPHGEEGNWRLWVAVVEGWMEGRGLESEVREGVWWGAGRKAYGVE